MKKHLLTATIMAALTLATVSVYAAPTFSGDGSIEYDKLDNSPRNLTNRIRLNIDDFIDNVFTVHSRIRYDNNLDTNYNSLTADQLSVNAKLNNLNFKAGKMPIWLGKGLLSDTSGTTSNNSPTGNNGLQGQHTI